MSFKLLYISGEEELVQRQRSDWKIAGQKHVSFSEKGMSDVDEEYIIEIYLKIPLEITMKELTLQIKGSSLTRYSISN